MSIRYKLILLVVMFACLATALSYMTVKKTIEHDIDESVASDMQRNLGRMQGVIERFYSLNHPEGINLLVSGYSADRDLIELLYADSEGKIVASTTWSNIGEYWRSLALNVDPDIVDEVIDRKVSRVIEYDSEGIMDGYTSICNNESRALLRNYSCGFIFYRVDLQYHLNQSISKIKDQAAYALLGIGVMSILLLYLLDISLSKRIFLLLNTVRNFAEGNRKSRSNVRGKDEVAILGDSINGMLERIDEDEELLRISEEMNKAVIDSAGLSIIRIDDKGIIQTFNKAAERQLGYQANEVIGIHSFEIFHDKTDIDSRRKQLSDRYGVELGATLDIIVAQSNNMLPAECECTYVRKNGSAYPVLLHVTALTEGGKLKGYIIIGYDLAERRKSEASARMARLVFENTHEGIAITDAQANIVDVNSAYEAITGYSKAEVIGKPLFFSVSNRHDDAFINKLWDVVSESSVWSGEIWDSRKYGEDYPRLSTISKITDLSENLTHYVTIFTDISEQKKRETVLEEMAFKDPLTGLPNRALFVDRLDRELKSAERYKTTSALLFLDLDKFKEINDTHGHDAGDDLLVEVANRLRNSVRKSDTVARLAGDEFVIIVAHIQSADDAISAANKVLNSLKIPVVIDDELMTVGISIGIAMIPDDGDNQIDIMKAADLAMYAAKRDGRGRFAVYSADWDDNELSGRQCS